MDNKTPGRDVACPMCGEMMWWDDSVCRTWDWCDGCRDAVRTLLEHDTDSYVDAARHEFRRLMMVSAETTTVGAQLHAIIRNASAGPTDLKREAARALLAACTITTDLGEHEKSYLNDALEKLSDGWSFDDTVAWLRTCEEFDSTRDEDEALTARERIEAKYAAVKP